MENQIENKPAAGKKKISPEIKKKIIIGAAAFVVIAVGIGSIAWINMQNHVYTDKAEISAAQINLSPTAPGVLEEVFVHAGDYVTENGNLARVGNEVIKAKSGGLVVDISSDIGKNFNPGEVVASIINPADLRVVGHVEENKGLKNIEVGQPAVFKVDAFGNKKYYGVVDEISDTSRQAGIVFNISDKREVRQFDVKVRFDISAYPELKNGMSAKIWIYKK
jgi:multidrug resistance efflux pump